MEQTLSKIEQKIDKLDSRIDNIDTHLAVYNEQLKIHIKRTNILEEDVKPIKKHVMQIQGVIKFFTFSIAAATAVIGIFKYINS